MKKILACLIMAIACVAGNNVMNISASEGYSSGEIIENTTIEITKDGMYNVTSGTLTFSSVQFTKNTSSNITSIITVGVDATLILNDVDFSSVAGSCAIINNGKVIANNVNFGKLFNTAISINSSITNPCVLGGEIYLNAITIDNGYVTLGEDANLLTTTKVTLPNGFVGKRVVTGDNTLASYYVDKFEFVDTYGDEYYLDYVGDDYSTYADGYKSSDTLLPGDIILTEDYAKYSDTKGVHYIAGKYCTGRRYVTDELSSQSTIIINSALNPNLYLNNINCLMSSGYSLVGTSNEAIVASVKIMCGGTQVGSTKQVRFPNYTNWSIFVDIPEDYDFVGLEDNGGNEISVGSSFNNSKFVKCIVAITESNAESSFDININVQEEVTTTNVDIVLEDDNTTYTSENLISSIKPYYMLNDVKNYVDFEVTQNSQSVEEVIGVGEYTISITTTQPDNVIFKNSTLTFNVVPKELSINYTNTNHRYDGSEKCLNAELVGVVGADSVSLTLNGNLGVTVGSYTVTAEINNPNYILAEGSSSCSLVIAKGIYDVTNIAPIETTFEYTGSVVDFKLNEEDIPSFITCSYLLNNFIVPNDYEVVVTFGIENNPLYDEVNYTTRKFDITITKKNVYMSGISLTGQTFTYDFVTTRSLNLVGELPDNVTIKSIENNSKVNAGTYEVKYIFNYPEDLLEPIAPITATMVILPVKLEVSLEKGEYEYTGSEITPNVKVTGIIDGDECDYTITSYTNVGEYSLIISLNNSNYYVEIENVKYSITPKIIDLSTIITLTKTEIVYNGSAYTPQISGELPQEIEKFDLVYSAIKNVGSYIVTADIEVGSNYEVMPWSKTITVTPKSITVTFDNYDGIYQDGTLKSIDVSLNGVIEDDFDKYLVTYSPRPIEAGNYTCTVTLMDNSNYVIVGSNSISFKIYPNVKVYTNDEMSVTIQGGNGNISDLVVTCTTKDERVENTLKSYSNNIIGYNVINFDGANEQISISLKTNLNISNLNKIKVFKIVNGNLVAIDFTLKDEVITFDGDSNYQYVIIEEGGDSSLIILIIVLGVATLALSGVVVVLMKRKNKRHK